MQRLEMLELTIFATQLLSCCASRRISLWYSLLLSFTFSLLASAARYALAAVRHRGGCCYCCRARWASILPRC